jgi:LDH2 family malate/lactate/ureidoglycolate dehydrogenase
VEGQKRVIVPGDPEREMEELRIKKGIPLLKPVFEDLKFLAEKFMLSF